MAGIGPAPKKADQRARRNTTFAMTRLPASGRKGRAPAWPLPGDVGLETSIHMAKRAIAAIEDEMQWATTARDRSGLRRKMDRQQKAIAELEAMKKFVSVRERTIWTALWKTPQATQWEKRGWFDGVALFARHQAKGEAGSLDDSKEARQREDRLGLNDLAMLRLRWETFDDSAASRAPAPKSKRNASRYGGLRVVAS